jgi:hypothetical protein
MRKLLSPFFGLAMLLATLVLLNWVPVVHGLRLVGWS